MVRKFKQLLQGSKGSKAAGVAGGAGASRSLKTSRQRRGPVQYICKHCGGDMVVNRNRTHPAFLQRGYKCLVCGRQVSKIEEMRKVAI